MNFKQTPQTTHASNQPTHTHTHLPYIFPACTFFACVMDAVASETFRLTLGIKTTAKIVKSSELCSIPQHFRVHFRYSFAYKHAHSHARTSIEHTHRSCSGNLHGIRKCKFHATPQLQLAPKCTNKHAKQLHLPLDTPLEWACRKPDIHQFPIDLSSATHNQQPKVFIPLPLGPLMEIEMVNIK